MKVLSLILLGSLLVGCTAASYRQVEPVGGGAYLLAQSPARIVHLDYPAGYYNPLLGYGFYPWWSHTYYSPNFYPHYFSFWYPAWPGYDHGRPDHYQPITSPPAAMPVAPLPAPPPLVVAPVDLRRPRPGTLVGEDLYRNPATYRHKGAAFAPRVAPVIPDSGPAAGAPPTVRSFLSPARSAPVFATGARAGSPVARPAGPSVERSHRPVDRSPPRHDR